MPTPLPGLKRVPRWRTMISPPVTVWPANTFTPRYLGLESRPLREEPRPFLCAISRVPLALDRRDADPRQFLAVTRAALVAALGLELEHPELGAAQVLHDLGFDGGLGQAVPLEHRIAVTGEQQRLQRDRRADIVGQTLDQEGLALDHAVLLTAGSDDCVGHCQKAQSFESASVWAAARERRRPPLRPRRRVREDSASSPPFSSSPSSATSA